MARSRPVRSAVTAVALLAALLASCGAATSSSGPPVRSVSAAAAVAPEPGCTTRYPLAVAVPTPHNAWVTACRDVRRNLLLKNVTSASVLFVTVVSGTASFKLGTPPTDTLAQRTVAAAVPSAHYPPRGVVLPPGVTLEASSTSPAGAAIDMVVDQRLSAQAVAAATFAEYAEDRFGPRAYRARGGLADCGRSAGEFADRAANSVEELLRATYGTSTACASVLQTLGEKPSPNVADDALRAADRSPTLKSTQWRTFFTAAARTVAKVVG
jgi:hypothetical protein